jgi:hypothetical protein
MKISGSWEVIETIWYTCLFHGLSFCAVLTSVKTGEPQDDINSHGERNVLEHVEEMEQSGCCRGSSRSR